MVEAFMQGYPPNCIVIVDTTMEDLEKGIVLANTLEEQGRCLLQVMNPHLNPLMIQPSTEVGMALLV